MFYGILAVPLLGLGIGSYIMWRWGTFIEIFTWLLFGSLILVGMFLRRWRLGRIEPIPVDNQLHQRVSALATKMGLSPPRLFLASPAFMARSKGLGAAVIGIVKPAILVSDFFIHGLAVEEQDATVAHELGHVKKSHLLKSAVASFTYFTGGWTLFLSGGVQLPGPNFIGDLSDRIAGAGLFLIVAGIFLVQTYLANSYQVEADSIAVNTLGTGDSLTNALQKLAESSRTQGGQRRYLMVRRNVYARILKIQELSREMARPNLSG